MADEEDLQRLFLGELDLTYCDFDRADLSNRDLRRRDFSHSLLHAAKFNSSDLSEAKFISARLAGAEFHSVACHGALFTNPTGAKFLRADLREARFRGSCSRCSFDECDLRGASFQNTKITNATFVDAVTDESTDFEGAACSRAMSRASIFQNYYFKEGRLHRKSGEELSSEIVGNSAGTVDAQEETTRNLGQGFLETLAARVSLLEISLAEVRAPGIGHNRPPESFEIKLVDAADLREIDALIGLLKEDPPTIDHISPKIPDHLIRTGPIAARLREHADIFAKEAVKAAGTETGKWAVRAALGVLALAASVDNVVELLRRLF